MLMYAASLVGLTTLSKKMKLMTSMMRYIFSGFIIMLCLSMLLIFFASHNNLISLVCIFES